MTVLVLTSCATVVKDYTFCALHTDGGAECNDFFNENPQSLTAAQFQALLASWRKDNLAVEVTNSQSVADIKSMIEQLCSRVACTEEESAAQKKALDGLNRIQKTSENIR